MRNLKFAASAFLLLVSLAFQLKAQSQKTLVDQIDIPYKKFVLENGLTLLVHEDHKAPIVAFNVWYHVGSKNEKQGKTGFAHLFEHLMFNGSENYNDDYFKPMQKIGATDLNGTTSEDRTNYFENVPVSALDLTLWMESDRMGHLKGAIDKARLDEQRGVVQNEKRQGDNQPFGITEELITKACFPPGHPYSWTVIGAMEDLDAAKLEDVKEWFDTYYGPNNAVICLAGDITPEAAFEKVKKYFGDIPPGPPISKHQEWISKRTGEHRQYAEDRIPQARIYKIWNIPPAGHPEADYLDQVSDVLSMGKTSRLYKRLVYDEQIASSVNASLDLREIAGLFMIQADVKPGVDIARVEKAIDEELAKFITEGPSEKELNRVKVQGLSGFIKGIERIGGFGGKSDVLARNQTYFGDPDQYKISWKRMNAAKPSDLQDAARKWLSDGVYVLEVHPYKEFSASEKGVDRKNQPVPGTSPEVKFPDVQKAKLSNGLEVVLAERHSIPVVRFSLMADAGYSADQGGIPGTACLAMDMLDEGTAKRNSLQINEEIADLGGNLWTGNNLDQSMINLVAMKQNLDASLDLYADILLNPAFPENDFKRLQKLLINRIQREKVSPIQIAFRSLPKYLFGEEHAYGNPWTGTGYEESVSKLTRNDMISFRKTWLKPNHSTLLIVGDITLKEILPRLEKLFSTWKAGDIPKKNIARVDLKKKSVVYIYDKPDAPQSEIIAAHLAPPPTDPEDIANETMNFVLGGDFVSRINMNIREDKHWSYGAQSFFYGGVTQRPFIVYAPVQSDKTRETMTEIKKELDGVMGTKPISMDELNNAKNSQCLGLPGQWETAAAVEGSLQELIRYNKPLDYFKTYSGKINGLKLKDLSNSASKILHPEVLQWVIIGDRAKIEKGIRAMGFDEIHIIDGDGKILQ
jgi:zinc protease